MSITYKLGPATVKKMLRSHSVLGLTLATLLYLLCVSGTFSVFYPNFERWEQPNAQEFDRLEPAALNRAIDTLIKRHQASGAEAPLEEIYVGFPSDFIPRATIWDGTTDYFITPDGELGETTNHEWTHFLVELHYAFNLPTLLGLSIVGILGVMLCAMIVSGILAHPNIFRDAFSFRLNKSRQLQQVDLHNRLSVWTAPFQFVIALTGALIGLSQIVIFIYASIFYQGDYEAAGYELYSPHPEATDIAAPRADVGGILAQFQQNNPALKPLGLGFHLPGTTAQMVEINALVPNRVVWAENFHYDGEGALLSRDGWSDGETGKQIYASTYRLHFGHFAGLPLQIAYLVFGLALCISIVSGINIWLVKKRQKDEAMPRLEKLWCATVWATPLAIAASALIYLAAGSPGTLFPFAAVFWLLLAACLAGSLLCKHAEQVSLLLRGAVSLACFALVILHLTLFGAGAFSSAGIVVNLLWLGLGSGTLAALLVQYRHSLLNLSFTKQTAAGETQNG